ncbi:MAG TPA: PQQ-dependent sugar dehydrogenase [Thermoanaerobaculia bacterium]|nr:PQQ-dependent sugar dehydrogenase [Thermoanaerobaculia bacterium]
MNILALILAALVAQAEPSVVLEPIANGLDSPVSITHAGDDRLFITLQDGMVVIYDGTQVLPEPFLDIRSLVRSGGERGLLSIAFHPRYAQNGLFYVNYTNLQGHTVVARYSVLPQNPDRANPNSALILLTINQPFPNHNGGQLQFGPDGYLYIGMGDGGSGGDPANRAQNLLNLLGKMLRIDVDSASPYAIPPSNPYANLDNARGEIWASGLRNPWRFSFDRATGDLWIADVGQGTWEEIDFQPATSIGGENYGWRLMEGTHCFEPPSGCNPGNLVLPVIEYDHDFGCSVTGGYVYRGTRSPRLIGQYIYGDYCSGIIWGGTRNANGTVTSRVLIDATFNISTFGEDAAGEVYVGGYSNGVLYRLVDSRPLSGRRRSVRK